MISVVKVTIALPTYNRASLLERCVRSVFLQTFGDYELIVIDDGSNDGTQEIVTKLSELDSRIRYHKNEVNMGLPKSRNIAVTLSKGDFVFFVEDDLTLHPKCLQNLIRTFNKLTSSKANVGAVGPRLIEESFRRTKCRRRVVEINRFTGMILADFGMNGGLTEVPTLHSCSLISKAVFKDSGGYDWHRYRGTSFREETDLYFRMRRKGYRLFYQPAAIGFHKNVPSGGSRLPHFRGGYYEVRNHVLFLLKFWGIKTALMIPCYVVYVASRLKPFLSSSQRCWRGT